jgi:hypothetical protein
MGSPEPNLSDLVLRIDAAIAEGREAELLAELDIPLGREDQFNAARDDLIRGLLTTPGADQRDLGFAEQPGWLRLGIIMASARWLAGQVRTCPHNPTAEQPEPVHLGIVASRSGGVRRMHPPTPGARAPDLRWLRDK